MAPRIVLIGAGSALFGLEALGDVRKSETLQGSTVVRNDINPESLEFVTGIAQTYVRDKSLPFTIEATPFLEDALRGAHVCVTRLRLVTDMSCGSKTGKSRCSTALGRSLARTGILEACSLRSASFLPFSTFAARSMKSAPEAHAINLSNPMVRIMHAIGTKYPNLKCTGICHEVLSLLDHVPKFVALQALLVDPVVDGSCWIPGSRCSARGSATWRDYGVRGRLEKHILPAWSPFVRGTVAEMPESRLR